MPKSIYKLMPAEAPQVDEGLRQVKVICSTSNPDRIGDVVVQEGIDLSNYKANPVVLWGHKSDRPVARALDIGVVFGKLQALVQFPPAGEDEDADWTYGKIKNRLVNAVSIGFRPKDNGWEPIDPKEPWGAWRFTNTELLEFSFCSVPMNAEALIIGRSITLRDPAEVDTSMAQAARIKAAVAELKAACPEGVTAEIAKELELIEAMNTQFTAIPSEQAKEFFATLRAAHTEIGQIAKAGKVLSNANEDRLRTAHNSIGEVLNQIPDCPPAPEEPDEPAVVVEEATQANETAAVTEEVIRPRRAEIAGRSTATQFPRRTAREVELLKMRAAL